MPRVIADTGQDTYTTIVKARTHLWTIDEPNNLGGDDKGPNPMEMLAASLAACTNITLQLYVKRKKWVVEAIHSEVTVVIDRNTKKATFARNIVIRAELDDEQKKSLLKIADSCPVHLILHQQSNINTTIEI